MRLRSRHATAGEITFDIWHAAPAAALRLTPVTGFISAAKTPGLKSGETYHPWSPLNIAPCATELTALCTKMTRRAQIKSGSEPNMRFGIASGTFHRAHCNTMKQDQPAYRFTVVCCVHPPQRHKRSYPIYPTRLFGWFQISALGRPSSNIVLYHIEKEAHNPKAEGSW